jgi:hypothetical protein
MDHKVIGARSHAAAQFRAQLFGDMMGIQTVADDLRTNENDQLGAGSLLALVRGEVTFCVRGVISPLLANIYLHYTLDLWATRWRRREATGDMIFVRYADDFVVGFQHESDARRFLDELHKRLREYALSLHPEKTRLIEFGRFVAERRQRHGLGKPETFTFLGFTFICGKTRADKFQIKRKTRADRMGAKLKMIKEEMWRRMHQPIPTYSGEMALQRRQWLLQLPRSAD